MEAAGKDGSMLWIALELPALPLQIVERAGISREPLVVAEGPTQRQVVACAEARGLQVRSCLALPDLRQRLADLPLFLLDWPEKTLARLHDLGILRLRDAFELPAEGISRRFGPEIALSLDHLLGRIVDPRDPHIAPARFKSRLVWPAEPERCEARQLPLRRTVPE